MVLCYIYFSTDIITGSTHVDHCFCLTCCCNCCPGLDKDPPPQLPPSLRQHDGRNIMFVVFTPQLIVIIKLTTTVCFSWVPDLWASVVSDLELKSTGAVL